MPTVMYRIKKGHASTSNKNREHNTADDVSVTTLQHTDNFNRPK